MCRGACDDRRARHQAPERWRQALSVNTWVGDLGERRGRFSGEKGAGTNLGALDTTGTTLAFDLLLDAVGRSAGD